MNLLPSTPWYSHSTLQVRTLLRHYVSLSTYVSRCRGESRGGGGMNEEVMIVRNGGKESCEIWREENCHVVIRSSVCNSVGQQRKCCG